MSANEMIGIFNQARNSSDEEQRKYKMALADQARQARINADPSITAGTRQLVTALGGNPDQAAAPDITAHKMSWDEYRAFKLKTEGVDVGPDPRQKPSSRFAPGQGGNLTPQTYKNWKENVQGKGGEAELIDTLKRYNPPNEGRNPTSEAFGIAPDVPMALRQAGANSAQAKVFKDMMANGGSGWIGGPQSGPGSDPMGQSNDFGSRIQMGLLRNAAAGDEDTNLKIVGRGIGANMGNRGPQSEEPPRELTPEEIDYLQKMKENPNYVEQAQPDMMGEKSFPNPDVGRSPQSINPTRPSNTMGTGKGSLYQAPMSPYAREMLRKIRESETMKLAKDFNRNAVGQPNATAQSSYAPPTSSYDEAVGALGDTNAGVKDYQFEGYLARRKRAMRPKVKSRLKSQMY